MTQPPLASGVDQRRMRAGVGEYIYVAGGCEVVENVRREL